MVPIAADLGERVAVDAAAGTVLVSCEGDSAPSEGEAVGHTVWSVQAPCLVPSQRPDPG